MKHGTNNRFAKMQINGVMIMCRVYKIMLVALMVLGFILPGASGNEVRLQQLHGYWGSENIIVFNEDLQEKKVQMMLQLQPNGEFKVSLTKNDGKTDVESGKYQLREGILSLIVPGSNDIEFKVEKIDQNRIKLTNTVASAKGNNVLHLNRYQLVDDKLVPVTNEKKEVRPVAPKGDARNDSLIGNTWVANLVAEDKTEFTRSIEFRKNGKCIVIGFNTDGKILCYSEKTFVFRGNQLTMVDKDGTEWMDCKLKWINDNAFIIEIGDEIRQHFSKAK